LTIKSSRRFLAAASLAAAMAGCGGGDGSEVPVTTVPPAASNIDFSIYANQAFSNSANSTPVSVNYTFNFDVNDDPTAFDALIASGSYGGS
jgi:hypothetical protein